MTYRRDIDGLRAVAVLAVILHHAGIPGFGAGLLGVDVFFVISGFLIGGIVLEERARGRFSYRAFYGRRVRRILPALFVVVIAVLAAGLVLLTPDKMRYLGGAAAAVLLFVSNVWFLQRTDYFNPEVAFEPLVHTWSLAVEEQFYIILPVLLTVLWRLCRRGIAAVLGLLAAASLGLAIATSDAQPEAAFYLIHTRAWELLAGVLAAMVAGRVRVVPQAATAGLAAILVSVPLIPGGAAWPGAWTVIPVAGTVLVLLHGAVPSAAHWLLTRAPMVWVGLISYSAYLWHQPILSFYLIATDRHASGAVAAGLIALTLALAALTWRFVEQPFRHRRIGPRPQALLLGGAAAAILAVAVGGHVTKGYPGRLPEDVRRIADFRNSRAPDYQRCNNSRNPDKRIAPQDSCRFGPDAAARAAPRVAIWGDSHAAVFARPLAERLAVQGIGTIQLTTGACPAMMGIRLRGLRPEDFCTVINAGVLAWLLDQPGITDVVVHGYWNNYMQPAPLRGDGAVALDKRFLVFPIGADDDLPEPARQAAAAEALDAAVSPLLAAGKRVHLIYPLPEAGYEVPDVFARAVWRQGPGAPDPTFDIGQHDRNSAPARALLDSLGARPGLSRIEASTVFCDRQAGLCRTVEDGVPMYHDSNHPSLPAAERIADIVARAMQAALAQDR